MSEQNTHELTCPMDGCSELLLLIWNASFTPAPGDLDERPYLAPNDAHVLTWDVRCVAGHVILLPGSPQCPCDDPDGEDCPPEHAYAYDWDEEYRTFRDHDWARLNDVMAKLSGGAA